MQSDWLLFVVVQLLLQCVSFTASRFEIEHEIFHIQSQLTESFLNEVQNSLATLCALDNPIRKERQIFAVCCWQLSDSSCEF